jgi:UrcA family protein
MNRNHANFRLMRIAPVALVAALVSGAVFAEEIAQVTVTASRPVKEVVGHSNIGAPIEVTSITSRVSYADLDLASHSGAATLETRINDAAKAACKELDKSYPLTEPDATRCAKLATDKAMVSARAAISAAEKNPHTK